MSFIEPLFQYNISARKDQDEESSIIAKDFKKGALDPSKLTNRLEKQ